MIYCQIVLVLSFFSKLDGIGPAISLGDEALDLLNSNIIGKIRKIN